jgi:hypothetical protein
VHAASRLELLVVVSTHSRLLGTAQRSGLTRLSRFIFLSWSELTVASLDAALAEDDLQAGASRSTLPEICGLRSLS